MRIVVGLGLIVFLSSAGLRAGTCFYNVDFNKDRVNEAPPTNVGTNNPTGELGGSPIVVRSFEQLTNQPLLLKGPLDGVGFGLARGSLDYTLDFDFETHNLSTSGTFDISFWGTAFELTGNGQMLSLSGGNPYPLGWQDDQVHHLHIVVNFESFANEPWTVQLDNNDPITETESVPSNPGDPLSLYLSLGLDTNVQVAIDNIVIGTTTDFVPLSPLFSFWGWDDGDQPQGRLARDSAGNFYVTAQGGGPGHYQGLFFEGLDFGTVSKIDKNGNLMWSFPFDGKNGAHPEAGVILGDDGFLYGTTTAGFGTVFKMSENGELIQSTSFDTENGANPTAELTQVRTQTGESQIFGTTPSGGACGKGTVFEWDGFGRIRVLHSFTGGEDGAQPLCRLCPGDDGYLYGTTSSSNGTVFKIDSIGHFKTIFSFDGINGSLPYAGLTKYGRGVFYGTTASGGTNNTGTFFRITSSGVLTTLYSFGTWQTSPYPQAELVLGRDGNFYGTTPLGGSGNIYTLYGTVFRISPDGDFQLLSDFHGGDGSFPHGAMIEGEPGKFYGTTEGGFFSSGNVYCVSAKRPVLVINRPSVATQISGSELEISGKAQCDPPVTNVFYCVNGGSWASASSTNSWCNWNGSATLAKGRNQIQAYAISAFGDLSRTNTLWIKW